MGMFPHTVTIYNVATETGPDLRDTETSYITVLRGVLLDAVKGTNVLRSGLTSADAVDLYIPMDVEAVDGTTGEPKEYTGPMEWARLTPAQRETAWTMTLDGQGEGDSFFIFGEVVEPGLDFEALSGKYDGVYNITKVDEKLFGGLPHWEVGGA